MADTGHANTRHADTRHADTGHAETAASPPARATLPPVLDMTAAPGLAELMRSLRCRPVTLDAGEVQRLATPCLQVLLAARRAWIGDGQGWAIAAPSEAFSATLALLGAPTLLHPTPGLTPQGCAA